MENSDSVKGNGKDITVKLSPEILSNLKDFAEGLQILYTIIIPPPVMSYVVDAYNKYKHNQFLTFGEATSLKENLHIAAFTFRQEIKPYYKRLQGKALKLDEYATAAYSALKPILESKNKTASLTSDISLFCKYTDQL